MIWRYILAFVLSVAVLIGWQLWMASRRPPPRVPPAAVEKTDGGPEAERARDRRDARLDAPPRGVAEGAGDIAEGARPPADAEAAERAVLPEPPAAVPRELDVTWQEGARGVAVLGFRADGEVQPVLRAPASGAGTLALAVERLEAGGEDAAARLSGWAEPPIDAWELVESGGDRWVHRASAGGLRITRTVQVRPPDPAGGSELEVSLRFENSGNEGVRFRYLLEGPAGMASALEGGQGRDLFIARAVREPGGAIDVASRAAVSVAGEPWESPFPALWVASGNAGTLAALISDAALAGKPTPVGGVLASAAARELDGGRALAPRAALESRPALLGAGEALEHGYSLYLGPREADALVPYAKVSLARANVLDVEVTGSVSFAVDAGRGFLASTYLLDFFEEPPDRNELTPDLPYRLLLEPRQGTGLLGFAERVDEQDAVSADPWSGPWAVAVEPLGDGRRGIMFEKTVGSIRVRKRVAPAVPEDFPGVLAPEVVRSAGGRLLKLTLELENIGDRVEELHYRVYGPTAIASSSRRTPGGDIQIAAGVRAETGAVLTQVQSLPGEGQRWERTAEIAWLGLVNSYFTSILFPQAGGMVDAAFAESIPYPSVQEDLAAARTARTWLAGRERLAPGAPRELVFGLYAGPRVSGFIDEAGRLNLEGANDYGFMSGLIHVFMWGLGVLKTVAFGSWGLAIILLTVIVKLCLHPINRKSQRSMMRFQKKFQKIQPQMNALKEKYGADRMRYSQEVQKLWREHGVNPGQQMLGCLVMLLQIPIWISLYWTLEYAIGLRHASFLWIEDLTQPDQLFRLPFGLPFLGEWFNILPVLYVVLTLVNQRMQPRPQDPQMQAQYRMMTFMMVFFGFIFYGFPAGFMLYIMTSAALGIAESKLIKMQLAREEPAWEKEPAAVPVEAAPYPARKPRPAQGGGGGTKGTGARKGKRRKR